MLRSLKLPGDFRVGVDLVLRGFQNKHSDKKEVAVDSLRTLRYLWPLVRIGQLVSPALRDYYRGYVWEEDSQPVGGVVFGPEGKDRWGIDIIVVLPEYRRRGIARNLMQASLNFIKERGGKVVVLEADGESEAACLLYKQLGFEQIYTSIEFNIENELTATWPLPAGYEFLSLRSSDWQTYYELDRNIMPAQVAKYDPLVKSRYRAPGAIRLYYSLLYKFSGQKEGQIAVRSPEGKIVAWGKYLARTRLGGVNYASMRVDPQNADVALVFESHLLKIIQKISPGRRIIFSIPDWQEPLIQASLTIGCTERNRYYRMGLFL